MRRDFAVMTAAQRALALAASSLALLALILILNSVHAEARVGPSSIFYFVAIGLPQVAVIAILLRGPVSVAFAVSAGVAGLMCMLCGAWSVLGYILAAANFGGYRPPDWYWNQWFAGCVLLAAQVAMGCTAYASLSRLTSIGQAFARTLGAFVIALAYSVAAFTILRVLG